jgi:hypothetical protein
LGLFPVNFLLFPQQDGFEKRPNVTPVTALKNNLYFCILPIRKVADQNRLEKTETTTLITGEVFKSLRTLNRWNIHWCINEPGHTVPDEDTMFAQLIHTTFDPDLTNIDNINNSIKKMIEQHGVDIIVTGLYHDDGQGILTTLRLLVYVKDGQKIVMKNVQFKRGEMLGQDPQTQQKKLHRSAVYKIAYMFRDILEFQVEETVKKILKEIEGKKLAQMYVSNLSFLNVQTQKIKEQTIISQLLNGPVVEVINQELVAWSKENKLLLHFNQKNHQLANTDDIVNQLLELTFDPTMAKAQKLEKIVNQMMAPHKVDVVVTGRYVENSRGKTISVRPVVLFKAPERIVTFNLTFPIDELVCEDPDSKDKIVCSEARDKIRGALLERLQEIKK